MLPVSVICGVKTSVVMAVRSSGLRLQTPIQCPAAMAAPSAVVSGIDGRTAYIKYNYIHIYTV